MEEFKIGDTVIWNQSSEEDREDKYIIIASKENPAPKVLEGFDYIISPLERVPTVKETAQHVRKEEITKVTDL